MTGEHSKYVPNNQPHSDTQGLGTPDQASPANPESRSASERTQRIRDLNDQLRTMGRGGIIHMTSGVAALGLPTVDVIFACIADFIGFTPDNDPWSEHDCAVMTILECQWASERRRLRPCPHHHA